MEEKIYLIPIGDVEKWILEDLDKRLENTFKCRVDIHEGMTIPQDAYNSKRNQYLSSHILKTLRHSIRPERQDKILGIIDVDLYAKGLNFVFGEAELGGHFAVISLTRLHQRFYDLPENQSIFLERTVKEAVHELGHVYGLRHCPETKCVMQFSNSLWDTDQKKASFCSVCKKLLEKLRPRQ